MRGGGLQRWLNMEFFYCVFNNKTEFQDKYIFLVGK